MGSIGTSRYTQDKSSFGQAGTYKAYRAGGIYKSPLGFLSFGIDKEQSTPYSKLYNKPIEEFNVTVKNPIVITGSDFDDMQDKLSQKWGGQAFSTGKTIEEQRQIMTKAIKAMEKAGHDAILMKKVNRLTGETQYEIGIFNNSIKNIKK